MSDHQVIEQIRSKDQREITSALNHLYQKCFPSVKKYIIQNRGTTADAADIFQEAVCAVYINITNGRFHASATVKTYLIAISRNLWLKELRRNPQETYHSVADHHLIEECLDTNSLEEYRSLFMQAIEKLKTDDHNLLKDYYLNNVPLSELKFSYNLGSVQAVKNKKSRALRKLCEVIRHLNSQLKFSRHL